MKIISCAGFGGTGSSIVTDLFREFPNVYSVGGNGFEFFLLHEPDGIKDLENALVEGHRFKVDLAIKRFIKLIETLYYKNPSGPNYKDFFNGKFLDITYEYLHSLNIIEWNEGWWHRIFENNDHKLKRFLKNLRFQTFVKKYYSLYEPDTWRPAYTGFSKQYYCQISRDFFIEKTKVYLEKLFSEINTDAEYLLFDQLFPPTDTDEYIKYFEDAKAFIVERDPMDLYFANKVSWGYGFIPFENVETFIKWYKETRKNIKKTNNVYPIQFEDFLFNTDKTINDVLDFVELSKQKHEKINTTFFPEKSKTNTQINKRYYIENKEMQKQLEKDLLLIQSELTNYLYKFPTENTDELLKPKKQLFIYEEIYKKVTKESNFISLIFDIPSICKYIIKKIKG